MPRRRWPPSVVERLYSQQGGLCGCGCGADLGTNPRLIEVDHVTALWRGGEDTFDNLQLLTKPCHRAKTNREARERAKGKRLQRWGAGGRLNAQDRSLQNRLERVRSLRNA